MTPKEKIMACIKGRPMDEYVNQFEYLKLVFDPATLLPWDRFRKAEHG